MGVAGVPDAEHRQTPAQPDIAAEYRQKQQHRRLAQAASHAGFGSSFSQGLRLLHNMC
jgi:hypothetical protein